MKRAGRALILIACCLSASAQAYWQSRTQVSIAGAAAYVGPGDIVSGAKAWYSCSWGYNASDTSPACNVCLPADTTCADVTLSAGVAVVPASLSTCNITTVICTVKTQYDKGSLAHNITQATEANRPTFRPAMTSNGCPTTSSPCMKFTTASSQQLIAVDAGFTVAQPSTVSMVYLISTANLGIYNFSCCSLRTGGGPVLVLDNGNAIVSPAVSTAAWFAGQFISNSTSSSVFQNGSTIASGDTGVSNPINQGLHLGVNGASFFDGYVGEWGIWPVAFNGTQQSNMNTNQRTTRWGF